MHLCRESIFQDRAGCVWLWGLVGVWGRDLSSGPAAEFLREWFLPLDVSIERSDFAATVL